MGNLCKYKDMFGKPNEGAHSIRIMNIAVIDVLVTIVMAIIISKLSNYKISYVLGSLFVLSIVAHRIFCVRTTIDKILFRD